MSDIYLGLVDSLTDCQLISVVSSVQNYTHEQTYRLAHNQVHVEGDPWDLWSRNFSLMPTNKLKLPSPVRIELEEALGKFIVEGRLKTEHFASVLTANMVWEERQGLARPPRRSFTDRLLTYIVWFMVFYSILSFLL